MPADVLAACLANQDRAREFFARVTGGMERPDVLLAVLANMLDDAEERGRRRIDERASLAETRRLRALEDAVTAFAKAVGEHDPPLIGFYPRGARADREESDAARASMREVFGLAVEAATMLERAHGVGTAAVAMHLRQWCEANRERAQ